MSDEFEQSEPQAEESSIDPAQVAYLQQRLHSEQNLLLGAAAGMIAALAGAAVWAGVTVVTGYQIGFMAIGVGFLVGYAIRAVGRGVDLLWDFRTD